MKKILVTGATGFIGSYVVPELIKQGFSVIASSGNEEKARHAKWFDSTIFIPFDFKSFETAVDYFDFFHRPDLMIHLAWEGLPNYRSSFHVEENLPRHKDFLANLIKNGLRDLTITGTCLEYGMQEGCLSEDMPVFPSNAYAVAKNDLRKYLEALRQEYSFSFKWVRLFYMYGKGQNPNSLLSQLDKAIANGDKAFNMSGGEQVRDFLPVEKVAGYIVKIALQDTIDGVINCCSNEPVSVKEFVKNYVRTLNKEIFLNLGYYPYTDYEPMRFWGDDNKLKSILNNE
jgi:dTDP-6-deoxy-L-talose 4-dehydrogenase (NAD+)